MNSLEIYKKLALILGTSAVAVSICSVVDGSGENCSFSQDIYLNESNLTNPYELKTNFISELQYNDPIDDPIVIPIVKEMKFKLGKPKIKEFSV
jgi:predicted ATPase